MRFSLLIVVAVALAAIVSAPVSAQTHYQAVIDGGQVVPSSGSSATGLGCFVLNPNGTLDYQVSYAGLLGVETGAHIHGPAPAGVNAGVQFPLPAGNPKIGSVGPLTAIQIADLNAGRYYVQIHTDLFPGGEIRGQILPSAESCSVATQESTWGVVKSLYQ